MTASNLDCGSSCGARFDYGTSLTLTAAPGRGSVFDGWEKGACAPAKTRCTVPVGPITKMLVFTFAPGCEPQPPSPTTRATITDVRAVRPVSFRRFLQRQQIPIPPDMTPRFLARKGVMVEFGYEIIGLSGKHLLLGWELSDNATNELVDEEQSTFELVPSKNDDAGDWAVWIPAPKPRRRYYATVKVYKPEGPPYELKHFRTETFQGFAST